MSVVIRPVAKSAPKIVDVPEEVAKDLTGLLDYFMDPANKGQVAYAKFDTAEEVAPFIEQARSWAMLHDPAVTFRKLAGKDLGDTELRFSLTLAKPAGDTATAEDAPAEAASAASKGK